MIKEHWLYIRLVLLSTIGLAALAGCGSSGSTAPTSSIGVNTSGIIGQGFVLQNNGADNLVITGNGFYMFSSPFVEGSSYNITILPGSSSPDQDCEVINGSGIVGPDNIKDVEVSCVTTFLESFDKEGVNPAYWLSKGEFSRNLVDGALEYSLSSSSGPVSNSIRFLDKTCGMISADITITEASGTGTGDKSYGTQINSCGYHTNTAGEAEGEKTGDVNAAIVLLNSEAFFRVYKCLNDDCNNPETTENLTPGIRGLVSLGEVPIGSTANLLIDWDSPIAPNQFIFQLNHGEAIHFDPVVAGADIDSTVPNVIDNYLGVKVDHSKASESASLTATFDNIIVNEALYDDFNSAKYLDGALWSETYGRQEIDAGRLLLETAQKYIDNPIADSGYHSTSYTSVNSFVPSAEIVQADIVLDPLSTVVIDDGDMAVLVEAVLEVEYRPPGLDNKDETNKFLIQGRLQEDPSGTVAMISVGGCVDSKCVTKYTIPNAQKTFKAPIAKGETYHFKIEKLKDRDIAITLTPAESGESETLTLDMSVVPSFANTEFNRLRLKTQTRGTDLPGEEAFVRAYFDNIQLGGL